MRYDASGAEPTTARDGPNRRQLLGALVAAASVGVAGCTGGGDGTPDTGEPTPGDGEMGSGSGNTETGTDTGGGNAETGTPGPATCADLTEGYTTLDPGEHPMIVRFERPTKLSEATYTSPPNFSVKLRPPNAGEAAYPKLLRLQQTASERGHYEEPYSVGESGSSTTFEFGGETLEALVSGGDDTVTVRTRIPFEFGRGKRYVNTRMLVRVFNRAAGGSIGEECAENLRTAAVHALETLVPNPATTMQAAYDEYN
jgi:hypothetical protein